MQVISLVHIHCLHKLVRQHELAIHLITGHPLPSVPEQRQRSTLQRVLQEGHVEQPVHYLMGVVEMDEESGEDQEGTDEERTKDCAILRTKFNYYFQLSFFSLP